MLCLIPFCEHDRNNAIALINWIRHLGGWGKHRLLTVAQPELAIEGVENIGDYERVKCNWSAEHKDASGVNSMFRQAAYWVYMNDRQPWLWNEPDAVWMRGGILDQLEAEYTQAGKPYMGPIRTAAKGRKHLGGVSVYPPNLPEIGLRIMGADTSPFDLVGGDEVLKSAHTTPLIAQHHRHPGFKTMEELQPVIDSGVALFHSNHDHSIIRLLGTEKWKRENNGTYPKQEEELKVPPCTPEPMVIQAPDGVEVSIAILKKEAAKSPLHKARLAKRLVAAGVIAEQKKPTGRPRQSSKPQRASSR